MASSRKKEDIINTGLGIAILPFLVTGCVTKQEISCNLQNNDNNPITSRVKAGKNIFLAKTTIMEKNEYSPVSNEITGKGQATREELAEYLIMHNPDCRRDRALKIASLYIREAGLEGINSDVAFIQMCLETGYLKYTGTVTPEQKNFCGLGTTSKSVKGACFSSDEEGVRAHIQHLKAYGSNETVKTELIDPRFHLVERNSAKDVYDLTGHWAMDPQYGDKLDSMLCTLEGFIFQNREIEKTVNV